MRIIKSMKIIKQERKTHSVIMHSFLMISMIFPLSALRAAAPCSRVWNLSAAEAKRPWSAYGHGRHTAMSGIGCRVCSRRGTFRLQRPCGHGRGERSELVESLQLPARTGPSGPEVFGDLRPTSGPSGPEVFQLKHFKIPILKSSNKSGLWC